MCSKSAAIKSFLDNYQASLAQVKCATIYDRFLLDLLLEQHQKAMHAFELLNRWGSQRSFDAIYKNIFEHYGLAYARNINLGKVSYQTVKPLFKGIKNPLLQYQFSVVLYKNELYLINSSKQTVKLISNVEKQDAYNQLKLSIENVETSHSLANLEQSRLITSLASLPPLESRLRNKNITELFFVLLQSEASWLNTEELSYRFLKDYFLNTLAFLLIGTLFSAAVLAVAYFAFHVIPAATLAVAAIGVIVVIGLGCAALFSYAVEKYLQLSIESIHDNDFTKSYNVDSDEQSPTPRFASDLTTELSDDQKKITISTQSAPQRFFDQRARNGANPTFKAVSDGYNSKGCC